jgi:hypothetical protein
MRSILFVVTVVAATLAARPVTAGEGPVPSGTFGKLDHVFLIIMENRTDTDIIGNPDAPFINAYAKIANRATNYFAVGHPSLPNYLALTGGSNFGVRDNAPPDWVSTGCVDHEPGSKACAKAKPPIAAPGIDNAVVATQRTADQCNGRIKLTGPPVRHNCALYNYPAAPFTPKSIADQLVVSGKSWATYQESLPLVEPGVAQVNYSDGVWSNLSPVEIFALGPVPHLYAVKHDPFAYFRDVELGADKRLALDQVRDFNGSDGLWANLQTGMPNFAVIVPNQCHDMHGLGDGPATCIRSGAAGGFLVRQGDAEVRMLVEGIRASPAWLQGRDAIVLVWDENDGSNAANRVVMLVETNYAANGRVSDGLFDHYSMLRTLEAGFDLPCLNHACDRTSKVMNAMFGG